MVGKSRTTINRWRKKRPIGFPQEYRPMGQPMFKRSEIVSWVEAQPLW
ncbi:hypothetical protein [Sphingomonas faeni]